MKNNKGFTLIELITTFALLTAIIVILVNIILIIKDIYVKYELKTELLIKQANLSMAMNSKFINGSLVWDDINRAIDSDHSAVDNGYFHYSFAFQSETIDFYIYADDYETKKIVFGDYVYILDESSYFGDISITEDLDGSNTAKFFRINIPIKNKFYPDEDFGINLVYMYEY